MDYVDGVQAKKLGIVADKGLEWKARAEKAETELLTVGTAMDEALRTIAFHLPVVCYEHDNRRYVDIEEVFKLKTIAGQARGLIAKQRFEAMMARMTIEERREFEQKMNDYVPEH